ncbi:MAG: hypothetical protein J3K34DRAFT_445541 [Monoraphidium minutum]|nr:MAG: hypothetical protein J3K34DRAFT_445541 [Monoraphidium minutum]
MLGPEQAVRMVGSGARQAAAAGRGQKGRARCTTTFEGTGLFVKGGWVQFKRTLGAADVGSTAPLVLRGSPRVARGQRAGPREQGVATERQGAARRRVGVPLDKGARDGTSALRVQKTLKPWCSRIQLGTFATDKIQIAEAGQHAKPCTLIPRCEQAVRGQSRATCAAPSRTPAPRPPPPTRLRPRRRHAPQPRRRPPARRGTAAAR